MLRIPVTPITERTTPPAIIPVPGAAGLMRTCAPLTFTSASCGIVSFATGIVIMCFFATSVALATAVWTSAPLDTPTPTLSLRLPTTTRALNRKRRPPLTTRATRSMLITTSSNSFGASGAPFRRSSRRPPRPCWRPRGARVSACGVVFAACSAILKLQSFFAGSIGKCAQTASVLAAVAVEYYLGYFLLLGRFCELCTE